MIVNTKNVAHLRVEISLNVKMRTPRTLAGVPANGRRVGSGRALLCRPAQGVKQYELQVARPPGLSELGLRISDFRLGRAVYSTVTRLPPPAWRSSYFDFRCRVSEVPTRRDWKLEVRCSRFVAGKPVPRRIFAFERFEFFGTRFGSRLSAFFRISAFGFRIPRSPGRSGILPPTLPALGNLHWCMLGGRTFSR
jgi:hypothetical protein